MADVSIVVIPAAFALAPSDTLCTPSPNFNVSIFLTFSNKSSVIYESPINTSLSVPLPPSMISVD